MANDTSNPLRVEVVYARPGLIWRRELDLPKGATALQALELSGVLAQHAELESNTLMLGIFGRICAQHHVLATGDRLEIYRPLVFDPMESRRRRHKHRQRRLEPKSAGSDAPTPARGGREKMSHS